VGGGKGGAVASFNTALRDGGRTLYIKNMMGKDCSRLREYEESQRGGFIITESDRTSRNPRKCRGKDGHTGKAGGKGERQMKEAHFMQRGNLREEQILVRREIKVRVKDRDKGTKIVFQRIRSTSGLKRQRETSQPSEGKNGQQTSPLGPAGQLKKKGGG